MAKGVAGKILRVNLSDRKISVEEPDEAFYRRYVGGAGLVAYYLLKETMPGVDSLSPDNKLIFAIGPMEGLPIAGAARVCVGAKAPMTGGFGKSEAGGFWPWELKRAGFDAIIVEGRADTPVYIWIHDGEVEIRDASHLWGKTVLEAHDAILSEMGDRLVRTAMIGPGGENLVRFASVITDLRNSAGRGGMGAVMGSKNLKGIAVRGHKAPEAADPENIRELAKWMTANYMRLGNAKDMHDLGTGTAANMIGSNAIGNLPVRNWGDGNFEEVAKITADAVRDTVRVGMEACAACTVRCKKVVEFSEPYRVDRRNGGPEYETLAALGSYCGVDDLKAICRGNELASLYSLDTISLGGAIAFAMECFEKEILTARDTGGIQLRFGNGVGILQLIEMIARREGIGDILAEGSRKAAEKIGKGAEAYAMHVKGLEFGMHEPRIKQGLGLSYAIQPHGADHCAGIHDTAFTKEGPGINSFRSLGPFDPMPSTDLSTRKVAMAKAHQLWRFFGDSVAACMFVPWSYNQLAEIMKAATGWDYTVLEGMQVGERVATMARAYNVREGFTAADDALPKRFFSPTPRGALKDTAIDPVAFDQAIHTYYGMMGWDRETGVPTVEKLEELGVGWVADEIKSKQVTAK